MTKKIFLLIAIVAIGLTNVKAQKLKFSSQTELVCDGAYGVPGVELMGKLRVVFNGTDKVTVKKMNKEVIVSVKVSSWEKDKQDYGDTWIFGFDGITTKAGEFNGDLKASGYVYINKKSKITDVGLYVGGDLLQLGEPVNRKDKGKKIEIL